MPTSFLDFARSCEELESTTKRKLMIEKAARFLNRLDEDEVKPAVCMMLGRAFPKWDQRVLEVSWATLSLVIREITGCDEGAISRAFLRTGDPGDATKIIFEESKLRKQATLFVTPLTILEVYRIFESIAEAIGPGSRARKEALLQSLMSSLTPIEAKYIVRILLGEMRTGFHEGLMEMAVSEAFKIPLESVQKASMLTGDVSEVAFLCRKFGPEGVIKIGLEIFKPIKPMLAQSADSIDEVLKEHEGETAIEYKLDGARIQVHKRGNEVKIFSRRLTDVTESLPEVVEWIKKEVKANEVILEGEVIATDGSGSPIPFQYLMRRFRRVREIESMVKEIPVNLFLFDLLFVNGISLIDQPYTVRRQKLAEVAGNIPLTKQVIAKDADIVKQILKEAVQEGHEGLMAKKLDSSYTPGIRGKKWFKIKQILEPLDLVIIAAEYGYGRRHGWLSDYYLAARDEETGEFLVVGKTFKGLTDEEIIRMTERLRELAIRQEGHCVIVVPKIVVEVVYNEIQRSPKYKCGMALRFARITRIRDDKSPDEADTIQRVKEIYLRQFEKKARYF